MSTQKNPPTVRIEQDGKELHGELLFSASDEGLVILITNSRGEVIGTPMRLHVSQAGRAADQLVAEAKRYAAAKLEDAERLVQLVGGGPDDVHA